MQCQSTRNLFLKAIGNYLKHLDLFAIENECNLTMNDKTLEFKAVTMSKKLIAVFLFYRLNQTEVILDF